ncbi:hypothetical protein ABIA39_007917 [Nocardia sp. GAS34]|uniref:hypothetical protein n=1 Tax=unclassified Nocardia TaxID=2637762 RepID=UPI003D1959FE
MNTKNCSQTPDVRAVKTDLFPQANLVERVNNTDAIDEDWARSSIWPELTAGHVPTSRRQARELLGNPLQILHGQGM